MEQKSPEQEEQERKELEEKRTQSLARILAPAAKERLNRIRLVKPEKARTVEDMILQMSLHQQLAGLVEDSQLMDLLSKISSPEKKDVTIVHRGKRNEGSLLDDNEDEDW